MEGIESVMRAIWRMGNGRNAAGNGSALQGLQCGGAFVLKCTQKRWMMCFYFLHRAGICGNVAVRAKVRLLLLSVRYVFRLASLPFAESKPNGMDGRVELV